jgi:hypothetical protein
MLRVQGAIGQANVIENIVNLPSRDLFSDLAFNQIEQTSRFLDASSSRRPNMHDELTAIGRRQEYKGKKTDARNVGTKTRRLRTNRSNSK